MINAKCVCYEENKKGATYLFENSDVGSLATSLDNFFASEGYKIEKGTPQNGVYTKGSAAAGAVLGALSGRAKLNVEVYPESEKVRVRITRGMTGAWGGLIGHAKMKNELSRLILKIKSMTS